MKKTFFLSLCLWACTPLPREAINLTTSLNSNANRPLPVQASASAKPSPQPTPVPSGTHWPANWQPVIVAPTPTPHREFFPTPPPSPTPTPIPASPQPERPANLAQGLVAHYPFEESLESINNPLYNDERNTTVIQITGIRFAEGIRGKSAHFRPVTDIPSQVLPKGMIGAELTKGFSFSVWVKMSGIDYSKFILGGAKLPVPYALFWTPGGAELVLNFNTPEELFVNRAKNPRPEVQKEEWQHWVVTHDLKTVKTYFNGQLDLEQQYSQPIAKLAEVKTRIGFLSELLFEKKSFSNGYHYRFGSYMDELRIYNRALGPEEVKQLYEYK